MSDSRKIKFKTLDNNLTEIEVDPNVEIYNLDYYSRIKECC
jgi:hypothetical protein